MPALSSDLRKSLESAVVKARELAERGARDALTALAVGASEPFASMSEEDRKLRNRLRAHGRQLGDQRDPQKGTQGIERLAREMAYEHWHRMLFARFLAENQLLIEPTSGVSISLDECEELASEEGSDLWELAAQFAQAMLPQIFQVDDPALTTKLPLEIRLQLQSQLLSLHTDIFNADDALGWTYQCWQAAEKDRINAGVRSGEKITSESLPCVTQLFTEDYMVQFLLDNTIGAWYAEKNLLHDESLAASSESDLRKKINLAALGGYQFEYLRFARLSIEEHSNDTRNESWRLAGGSHKGWPQEISSIRVLDPCCGSGHFLVAVLKMLVRLRMTEEGLDVDSAIRAVLSENIFGLEIDPRCTQIAAFNVAFAAWKLAGRVISLPNLQIACSGKSPNASRDEWLAMAEASEAWEASSLRDRELIRNGLAAIYEAFDQAPDLGSLISPTNKDANLFTPDYEALEPFLVKTLSLESLKEDASEQAVAAKGMAMAAKILSNKFDLVLTNFPFLGFGKQNKTLTEYLKRIYPLGFRELATAFLLRAKDLLKKDGKCACVMPSDWTHSPTTSNLRKKLLQEGHFDIVAFCGSDAFSTPLRVSPVLVTFSFRQSDSFSSVLNASDKTFAEKPESLRGNEIIAVYPDVWKKSPACRIVFDTSFSSAKTRLGDYAEAKAGVSAGDGVRFERQFWEVSQLGDTWELLQGPPEKTGNYFGRSTIVRWENESGQIRQLAESVKHLNHIAQNWQRGRPFWGKHGIVLSQFGNASIYSGEIFDCRCFVVKPTDDKYLPNLIKFALDGDLTEELKGFDSGFAFRSPKALLDIPFEVEASSSRLEDINKIDGYELTPFSRSPNQWLFHGFPDLEETESILNVSVCRLLGYQWPAETGKAMKLSAESLAFLGKCGELSSHVDNDGIVCLGSIRGEASAADRLREFLSDALNNNWTPQLERRLLLEQSLASGSTKTAKNLDEWLRDFFFVEHCKTFYGKPFIWHIWDGNPKGFNAFVNYHKIASQGGEGRKILEQLAYSYLGDWIDRQRLDQAEGVEGADDRLAAALNLQTQLKNILEGHPPYDIFVRWKPLHQQPIGWDPDVNDGVRINIRPFLIASLRTGGKKGAGVLRAKPGPIKWTKDRGQEPFGSKEDFPWFWGWDENSPTLTTDFGAPIPGAPPAGESFDGNRWNDLHYTRAAKEAARARHRGEG